MEQEIPPYAETEVPGTGLTVYHQGDEESFVHIEDDGRVKLCGPNDRWLTVSAPQPASLPPGVSVRHVWAVRCDDGVVYRVHDDSYESAAREATLLRNGVPGDAERTPEPGARPVDRYEMTVPDGVSRVVATGWRALGDWSPDIPDRTERLPA